MATMVLASAPATRPAVRLVAPLIEIFGHLDARAFLEAGRAAAFAREPCQLIAEATSANGNRVEPGSHADYSISGNFCLFLCNCIEGTDPWHCTADAPIFRDEPMKAEEAVAWKLPASVKILEPSCCIRFGPVVLCTMRRIGHVTPQGQGIRLDYAKSE